MNKVWVLPPREDWIVDRFVKEWAEDNADITVSNPADADVIWLLADWAWRQVPAALLASKKVLATVHHIVPSKFGWLERQEWAQRDLFVTAYQVYNQRTLDFIRPLTQKPIHLVKYWANQRIWRPTGTKGDLRRKHGLPEDGYLVGSFQRDTEGAGIPQKNYQPKREKGPQHFCDFIANLSKKRSDICVILGGWRRQYVLNRFRTETPNVRVFSAAPEDRNQKWFERPGLVEVTWTTPPSQYWLVPGAGTAHGRMISVDEFHEWLAPHDVINDLYQAIDLYPITSEAEGGPQALIEAGLLNVPVVSRPVGIAEQVLPPTAINDDVSLATPAVPNVEDWKLPQGYQPYRDLIQSL
jgi:glycosyltransferase involved in cell wall biosynthesis